MTITMYAIEAQWARDKGKLCQVEGEFGGDLDYLGTQLNAYTNKGLSLYFKESDAERAALNASEGFGNWNIVPVTLTI